MPLSVKISQKVKGAEGIFHAKGTLEIEGKDCGEAKVLVQDLGNGVAELTVNDEIKSIELNGTGVAGFKGNISADYEGEALKVGTELTFSMFSFVHKN